MPPAEPDDPRIARACRFIDDFDEGVPTLREIAAHVGLSPAWLQKRFTRALGVSPKQYADRRRRERLKSLLRGAIRSPARSTRPATARPAGSTNPPTPPSA